MAAAQQAAAYSAEQLAAIKAEGQRVASTLEWNELATRRTLIDQDLIKAGWNVGAKGKSTEEVGQEINLKGMPTPSGDGVADYVLWGDNGKPLAVIEAKRTAKSAREGQKQAEDYANCLEKMHGQRPVIFFTNGLDLFIWDDAQKYSPRKIYGYYSKDSLQYLILQRSTKVALLTVEPNLGIADRMYQLEAIKRVSERFTEGHRTALLVQATGTGKTRVAISLCDVLSRAQWAKRILFLCDRVELRKQADNAFQAYLPSEPRMIISGATAHERKSRIYLATYPAMMACFESFDVGYFDLIIADESHRSLYNRYKSLFLYFDALRIGLTATPVKFIDRNTYTFFGCEDKQPTASFGLQEAIESTPPYLVPPHVYTHTTKFLREGIKYSQMSAEQRAQLEADEDSPENIEFDAEQVDRQIFNEGTTKKLLRNVMERGIREGTESRIGKTIVFARSHDHAVHLLEVFEKLYPQYGGKFCRIIDHQEARREQLIEDFKDPKNELTMAISVDMLDTGIDVPEVVNLVFAKPVKSFVKFWQMVGRGTRLCKNLFGAGKHKKEFLVFDHWDNFRFFDEEYVEKDPPAPRSLLQRLFEARVALAAAASEAMNEPVFQATVDLLVQDIRDAAASKSIEVRDRARELALLGKRETVAGFAPATRADLLEIAAPLMQWRDIRGEEDAYRFDLLVTQLEEAVLRKAPRVADLRARVENEVELLMKNQNPVKAKADAIQEVRSKAFWACVTVPKLEGIRGDLRGIMKYQQQDTVPVAGPRTIDVDDGDIEHKAYMPNLEGLALVEYRQRIESTILLHCRENTTLYKIRSGKTVGEPELKEFAKLILSIDDKADVAYLAAHQPETRESLFYTLRGLVGLDLEAVDGAFTAFVHHHPRLSAQQLHFLQILKGFIAKNGGIEIERLYEAPFTSLHAGGIDCVFTDPGQVDEITTILAAFTRQSPSGPQSKRAS